MAKTTKIKNFILKKKEFKIRYTHSTASFGSKYFMYKDFINDRYLRFNIDRINSSWGFIYLGHERSCR
jgi:hypothetical protein